MTTEYKVGESYLDHSRNSIMIVGKDSDLDYLYFIGIQFYIGVTPAQIPFVPIHKDILDSEIDFEYTPSIGKPSSIQESIDYWLQFHNGGKTFFTVDINSIIKYNLQCIKDVGVSIEDYKKDYGYLLPIMFPTSKEMQ